MSLDAAYRHALDEVPGIRSYRVVKGPPTLRGVGFDGRLKLRTEAGDREFLLQIYRSHLTNKLADHIIAAGKSVPEPLLILAPHIGAGLSAKLVAARLNYLDAQGNCHIAAPPLHIHVQGKTAAPAGVKPDKGLRSAAYQVLFVYLAEHVSLDAPLRSVAERAGVSRQPVFAMKHRLIDEGYVFEAKTMVRWHPERRKDALNLWLHGYETVVRPSLVLGTYRTQDASPDELEQRITRVFSDSKAAEFRWGGSAAGFRLTGHYRGQSTVIHLNNTVPRDLHRQLRALKDPSGNLVLLDAFGSINWQAGKETVHPLLVYSEMLHEGGERAREAARELYEKHLAPLWAQGT